MYSGLIYCFGYAGFIFFGTYYWFTWDIVEPITYFMDLSACIALMTLFFVGKRSEYDNNWFHNLLKQRYLKKNPEWV